MTSATPPDRPCFVTGANAGYFWLAGALLQTLDERVPGVDVRVMDFGLAPPQVAFLRERGRFLARPAGVPAGLHPYVLKTLFGRYVRELPHERIVWLDGDVVCVGDAGAATRELFDGMARDGRRVAACPDMGPHPTLARFTASYPAPALATFVRANPPRGELRYLNTGVIAFRDARRFFDDWERLAARMPGETCIDQNAFNILVHADPPRGLVLDAGVWNVHGTLLREARASAVGWTCAGRDTPAVFLHATAHHGDGIGEVKLSLAVAGVALDTVVKTFHDAAMRRAHLEALRRFVAAHADALRSCGVVG